MIYIIVGVCIINLYISVLLFINNMKLHKEIKETKEWCSSQLDKILEEEKSIDKLMITVINDIKNNNVTDQLIDISGKDYECPRHKDVCNAYKEHQMHMESLLMDITERRGRILLNSKDKLI